MKTKSKLEKDVGYSVKDYNYYHHKSLADIKKPPVFIMDGSKMNPVYEVKSKRNNSYKNKKVPETSKGNYRKTARNELREYLKESSLHGLRYIGNKKLTWCERYFWMISFGCSLVSATIFIMNVMEKWNASPMIVSINPQNVRLEQIPFPAITICNVNQAKKSVADRLKKVNNSINLKLLESLCSVQDDVEIFNDKLAESATWEHTRSFLINVTQPCNEMLVYCQWESKEYPCQDLFNAQLSDEGLCCTFNVVHRNKLFRNPRDINDLNLTFPSPAIDWTPEAGFPDDAPVDGFPWRPQGIGTDNGFTVVLDANVAEYYCASIASPGFKILLHNPVENPKIADLGEIYAPGVEARVAIEPKYFDARDAIRSIDISKRHCLFSNERQLLFYKTYTINNCEMECEAKVMLEICNCVHYYMPKNKSTRVCGKSDAKCYSYIKDTKLQVRSRTCEVCLPSCFEVWFSERMSCAPFNDLLVKQHERLFRNKSPEYVLNNIAVVHFYFDQHSFVRLTKDVMFGFTEFLSNTGGLLSLCNGFSMMSAVELIYYLTLKLFCKAIHPPPTQPYTS